MSAQLVTELEPARCPNCDERIWGVARHEVGPVVHLAPITNPRHADLVVTRRAGTQLLVRDRDLSENVADDELALRHRCMPHPFSCNTPVEDGPCGGPARLFPGGAWCERHRP